MPLPAVAKPIHAILCKNAQCSCCEGYAAYLDENGFGVEVKPVNDRADISSKAGAPANLDGCHSMLVEGCVVDGLVQVDVVQKLLTEKPAIAGIPLPGMPMGAPGMGEEKTGPWTIHVVYKNGTAPMVYATERNGPRCDVDCPRLR